MEIAAPVQKIEVATPIVVDLKKEKDSTNWTQIIVALMGLIGSVGAGTLAGSNAALRELQRSVHNIQTALRTPEFAVARQKSFSASDFDNENISVKLAEISPESNGGPVLVHVKLRQARVQPPFDGRLVLSVAAYEGDMPDYHPTAKSIALELGREVENFDQGLAWVANLTPGKVRLAVFLTEYRNKPDGQFGDVTLGDCELHVWGIPQIQNNGVLAD